ncbi:NAD(P)H-hydrate dehydratase [Massilia sp. W12]|uniref:NAD(P)H-hydrate dehydratase n=1 Tax=Massilia sp. W12 TaxID=3126507 RepID=UPI0030D3F315
MNSLFSVAQIREIEQAACANLATGALMQRAGAAAARLAQELVSGPSGLLRVLVLAGPGNNGGDALDCAARLSQAGMQVSCLLLSETGLTPDADLAHKRARASAVHFIDPVAAGDPASSITSTRWHLVIDGLFGIGLTRPLHGDLLRLVHSVNHFQCPVLALDVPSGLDADTGNVVGFDAADPHAAQAIRASHTITFIGDKPGLHTGMARDYVGQVHVARLEIDSRLYKPSHLDLNTSALFARCSRQRLHYSHKLSHGNLAIIGGAPGMSGALILAARAALLAGAGRVQVFFVAPQSACPPFDPQHPELMCRPLEKEAPQQAVQVVGPGMGSSKEACIALKHALSSDAALVLDADALNLLSLESGLQQLLRSRRAANILTPHPLEAARLLGQGARGAAQVQADRIKAARELAQRYASIVILKGSGSIIANPHGHVVINPTGGPALATAGTGDVLAGLCGALLAQQWPAWEAALAACWLHGKAGDSLTLEMGGACGICASELPAQIRRELNQLLRDHPHQALR